MAYTKASTTITYSNAHEITGAHELDQQKPGPGCIYCMYLYIYPPHATGSIVFISTPHVTFRSQWVLCCNRLVIQEDKPTSLNSSLDGRGWFLGWIDVVCALVHCFNKIDYFFFSWIVQSRSFGDYCCSVFSLAVSKTGVVIMFPRIHIGLCLRAVPNFRNILKT